MAKAQTKYVPNMGTAAMVAHNMGNKQAINQQLAEIVGVDNGNFLRAKNTIENGLHSAYAEYFKKSQVLATSDEELQKLRGKCFEAWRAVLAEYTPQDCTKKIRIRNVDLDFTLGDIKKNMQVGTSVWGISGKQMFRKIIETYIGNLIAEQVVLDEDEAEAVEKYQGALRRIDSNATKRKEVQESIVAREEMLGKYKNNKAMTKYIKEDIAALKNAIKELDASDKNARETLKKFKAKFEAARLKIKQPVPIQAEIAA